LIENIFKFLIIRDEWKIAENEEMVKNKLIYVVLTLYFLPSPSLSLSLSLPLSISLYFLYTLLTLIIMK